MKEQIETEFHRVFDVNPDFIIQAPGRINLIGEHTDYNGGLVLPAAIDRYVCMAFGKTDNPGIFEFYAVDFNERYVLKEGTINKSETGWVNFFLGILKKLYSQTSSKQGLRIAFMSNIPIGAGMSSSSAIECAFLWGINHTYKLGYDFDQLIAVSQWSNHNFLGIQGGIMDQFTSFNGKKDHCILLDCTTYKNQYIPLNLQGYKFILFDTKVKHEHATGEYNSGPEASKTILKQIQKKYPEIKNVSQFDKSRLSQVTLSQQLMLKAEYVMEENKRVLQFAGALKAGAFQQIGDILYRSHEGLSEKYSVSCKELDFLVDQSKEIDEILGSRMMGGGFGGCTINLVKEDYAEEVLNKISDAYKKRFSLEMECYQVNVVDGICIF